MAYTRKENKEPKPVKATKPKKKKVILPDVKLFGKWDNKVEVHDPGLKNYINLKPILVPKSLGVNSKNRFHKSRMHIVERLALHMQVPGHVGKRHRITSKHLSGMMDKNLKNVELAFEIIEEKTKKNPVEVLVRAIENSALHEEVTSYQLGSITARDAVISSPQRRVDQTLKAITQGAYRATFKKRESVATTLSKELIAASTGAAESHAVRERDRIEREAAGAR